MGAVGVAGSTTDALCSGGLADTLGRAVSLVLMFIGMALALFIWLLSSGGFGLAAFALVYGVFYGGFVAILPALVMDYFGGRNVGSIIGVLYTSVAAGTFGQPQRRGVCLRFEPQLHRAHTVQHCGQCHRGADRGEHAESSGEDHHIIPMY